VGLNYNNKEWQGPTLKLRLGTSSWQLVALSVLELCALVLAELMELQVFLRETSVLLGGGFDGLDLLDTQIAHVLGGGAGPVLLGGDDLLLEHERARAHHGVTRHDCAIEHGAAHADHALVHDRARVQDAALLDRHVIADQRWGLGLRTTVHYSTITNGGVRANLDFRHITWEWVSGWVREDSVMTVE
jgi:hypothetical protein